MAEELRLYGIEKRGEQFRTKIKKLKQEFKKIKHGHKEIEGKFYNRINDIMGDRPSVTPPVIFDTL